MAFPSPHQVQRHPQKNSWNHCSFPGSSEQLVGILNDFSDSAQPHLPTSVLENKKGIVLFESIKVMKVKINEIHAYNMIAGDYRKPGQFLIWFVWKKRKHIETAFLP